MASHVVLREQLLEMGFDEKLIGGALKLLKDNATLESVIESIDSGAAAAAAEKPDDTDADTDQTTTAKALTPEELEAKKKNIEEKMKQRRAEIEAKEKEAQKIRELSRRKDGQEMSKLREELQKMQQQNYIDNLKKDKEEAKAARDKILKQIEQDKAERKARFPGGSGAVAADSEKNPTVSTSIANATNLTTSTASKTGKTKLAIRMIDGSQLIQEFDDKEVLSAVRAFVVATKNIDFNITFAMSPRPPFSEADMEKSLFMLGLSPNARLQVIKR